MAFNIFEKIQRRNQISLLKKHKKVSFNDIRLGNYNHFILAPDIKILKIDHSASLRNFIHIFVGEKASLEIGKNFFMNNFCSINCLESISIGDNVLFGENVKLYDHNHSYETTPNFKIHLNQFNTEPITIGNNCWLGSNVTVLKGVTIGDNSIIGTGCVIYKDVPSNTILMNRQELISKSFNLDH
ncbi:acyltransferase [Flavobacterium sp. B17]|uniref:acyltransferase n=1 Tax=Flavobacterium sp. B17 TaxID=95618 RepID=UPI0003465DA3|nr:acyltransferase [Flavobacterium sp. B17]